MRYSSSRVSTGLHMWCRSLTGSSELHIGDICTTHCSMTIDLRSFPWAQVRTRVAIPSAPPQILCAQLRPNLALYLGTFKSLTLRKKHFWKTQPCKPCNPITPVCLAAQLGNLWFLALTFVVMSSEIFVIQLSASGAEGFYQVPLTVSTGTGNVPRVRAQCIKKGKPRSMDQLLSCLVERTAEMTVAFLLLSSIWTIASGNSSLSVCLYCYCNGARDVGGPASLLLCCGMLWSPPLIPLGQAQRWQGTCGTVRDCTAHVELQTWHCRWRWQQALLNLPPVHL